MHRLVGLYAALSVFTSSLAVAQPAAEDFAALVRSGQVYASQYDFAASGFLALDQAQRQSWREDASTALVTQDSINIGCADSDLRGISALAWVRVAAEAPDAETWAEAASALRAEIAAVEALGERRALGHRDAGLRRSSANRYFEALRNVSDPRGRAALEAAIRDQTWRMAYTMTPSKLPPLAREHWASAVGARLAAIDCANIRWMQTQFEELNWFDIPTFGARVDNAAWLIAQHADRAPDFQREVLARLERLPDGHTNLRNLAFLWDRVAVSNGRMQRYGTQIHCRDGVLQTLNGIENIADVDVRRAEMGLPGWDVYFEQVRASLPCG